MTTITYVITYLYCPKCKHRFRHRRIAPQKIECGSCGAVLDTDLPTWDDLTTADKVRLYLSEIILPSWFGVKDCTGALVACLIQMFLWTMVSMPFLVIIGALMGSADDSSPIAVFFGALLLFVSPFIYPGILALRVRRMARESQEHAQTGQTPVWGAKKRNEEGRTE